MHVRVLSQNCFCPVVGGGVNPIDRLDVLVNAAREYDVLLLQEIADDLRDTITKQRRKVRFK